MKIITKDFPNDNEVLVDKIQVTYLQNPDNCSKEDEYQELILQTKDGGGGKYVNIKTGEHGWSIDNNEDITDIINHFRKIYE